jgi:hypothetical protein
MNKKLLFSLAAGMVALLAACSGDVVNTNNNPIDPGGTLKVRVVDASTGEPVQGASVTVTSAGKKAVITNDNGIAEIPDVFVGSHFLLVEKAPGYATTRSEASISGDAGGNVYIAKNAVAEVEIYPLTAALEGYLFYNDKDNNRQPATGFEVLFKAYGIVDEIPPAIVDDKGKYSFSGLPAISSYSLVFLPKKVGDVLYRYDGYGSYPSLRDNATVYVEEKTLSKSAVSFSLLGCSSKVGPKGAITCYFTDDAKENLDLSDICVSSSYGSCVEEASTIAFDGNKITITPFDGWSGSYVYVGDKWWYQIEIITVESEPPVDLTALTISDLAKTASDATSATFTWSAIEGATGYELFYKDDVGNFYQQIYCSISGTTTMAASCTFPSIGTKTLTFIARATNSTSKTTFDGAKTATVTAP